MSDYNYKHDRNIIKKKICFIVLNTVSYIFLGNIKSLMLKFLPFKVYLGLAYFYCRLVMWFEFFKNSILNNSLLIIVDYFMRNSKLLKLFFLQWYVISFFYILGCQSNNSHRSTNSPETMGNTTVFSFGGCA